MHIHIHIPTSFAGLDLSNTQATAVMRRYDADGSGALDMTEFSQLAFRLGAPKGGVNPVAKQVLSATIVHYE